MKRYQIPRVAFINKMDRTGANPYRVVQQLKDKLGAEAFLMQVPIGAEENFQGVVDLIEMEAYTHGGTEGEEVIVGPIPDDLKDEAAEKRTEMLEALSMYNDEMMELLLSEEEVPKELVYKVTRDAIFWWCHSSLHGHRIQEQRCSTSAGCHHPLPAKSVGS